MAASYAAKEGLSLRKLMADIGKSLDILRINTDNTAAEALLKNPVTSARSKHIDVLHHFVRERVMRKEIAYSHISTDRNIADCLTKALPDLKFATCVKGMGIC